MMGGVERREGGRQGVDGCYWRVVVVVVVVILVVVTTSMMLMDAQRTWVPCGLGGDVGADEL